MLSLSASWPLYHSCNAMLSSRWYFADSAACPWCPLEAPPECPARDGAAWMPRTLMRTAESVAARNAWGRKRDAPRWGGRLCRRQAREIYQSASAENRRNAWVSTPRAVKRRRWDRGRREAIAWRRSRRAPDARLRGATVYGWCRRTRKARSVPPTATPNRCRLALPCYLSSQFLPTAIDVLSVLAHAPLVHYCPIATHYTLAIQYIRAQHKITAFILSLQPSSLRLWALEHLCIYHPFTFRHYSPE